MVEELLPIPPLFNKGDSGVFELCCCKTLTTDEDLLKNFPGVCGNSELIFEFLGAGEPDNRTLLTDFLNALAMGVDNIDAIDVTFDRVFFLLLMPLCDKFDRSDVLEFKMLQSSGSSPFFLFLFLN